MRRIILLFAMLALMMFPAVTPAGAASQITSIQFVNVQVFAPNNCAIGDDIVNFGIVVNGTPGGTGSFELAVTLGGSGTPVNYLNTVPDTRLGISLNASLGIAGSVTFRNGSGWTAQNGTATITVTAGGVGPATLTINCATRAVSIANFGVSAPAAPAVYAGPPIPAGFVLRTITCDVAIFNGPGGAPLATGQAIRAGQTWFVNPTPVDVAGDAAFPQWTEIFTSGIHNGFIPTACVGG
ncbi:MAG: hypothetical protein IT323_13900 [Anaerolineae bacterium]|nr:hypothetical protein [Anaerolineae bacterium]